MSAIVIHSPISTANHQEYNKRQGLYTTFSNEGGRGENRKYSFNYIITH